MLIDIVSRLEISGSTRTGEEGWNVLSKERWLQSDEGCSCGTVTGMEREWCRVGGWLGGSIVAIAWCVGTFMLLLQGQGCK